MYAVVSCKKYNPNVLRVANVAHLNDTAKVQAVLNDSPAMECRICGSCSHVELQWKGWHTVHSVHNTEQGAMEAAWALCSGNRNHFDESYLKPLEEQCSSTTS